MRSVFFIIVLSVTCALAGDPPATKEKSLPVIKGSLEIPEDWFFSEESGEGIFVYHFTREKVDSENEDYKAGLTLSVTTKVPEKAGIPPSEYAASLMESSQGEDDNQSLVVESSEGTIKVYRLEYDFENEKGKMRAVNIAKANDTTGTLYFLSWQSPIDEAANLDALREKVLSSVKVDPNF